LAFGWPSSKTLFVCVITRQPVLTCCALSVFAAKLSLQVEDEDYDDSPLVRAETVQASPYVVSKILVACFAASLLAAS
jgi:hypothetical protein